MGTCALRRSASVKPCTSWGRPSCLVGWAERKAWSWPFLIFLGVFPINFWSEDCLVQCLVHFGLVLLFSLLPCLSRLLKTTTAVEALYVEVVKDGLSVSEMMKLLDQVGLVIQRRSMGLAGCWSIALGGGKEELRWKRPV